MADIADRSPERGALVDATLDRRRHSRHLTLFRIALLHVQDAEIPCVVREISEGGLSAQVYQALATGHEVRIELQEGELIQGSVIWVRGWEVGIEFADSVDIDRLLHSRLVKEDGRRQRLPRIHVECRARLRIGARCSLAVVHNISQRGAKLEMQKAVPQAGDVVLTLPDLPPLGAMIRWRDGPCLGLSFIQSLPFESFAIWLQARRGAVAGEVAECEAEPLERIQIISAS